MEDLEKTLNTIAEAVVIFFFSLGGIPTHVRSFVRFCEFGLRMSEIPLPSLHDVSSLLRASLNIMEKLLISRRSGDFLYLNERSH